MADKWEQYAVADSPTSGKWDKYVSTSGEDDDKMLNLPKGKRESLMQMFKDHPFNTTGKALMATGKALTQPALETATGKSIQDRVDANTQTAKYDNTPKSKPFDRNLGNVQRNSYNDSLNAGFADQATVPANYVGGKLIEPAAEFTAPIIKGTLDALKQMPNNILRGGLSPREVTQLETTYGKESENMLGNMAEHVKDAINTKISEADAVYKNAIGSFKGNQINSSPFFQAVQKGLRDKGWVDLRGNPTNRYKAALDPVYDKLTGLYEDLKSGTTNAGKKITGQVMSKEDFSTYRDALGAMLREKPTDTLVMSARNALYNSAEKSGMTGIKTARDLERSAFTAKDKFLTNTGDLKYNEKIFARIGKNDGKTTGLTKDQIQHLKELENYTGKNILKDANQINRLHKAVLSWERKKDLMKGVAIGVGAAAAGLKGGDVVKKLVSGG